MVEHSPNTDSVFRALADPTRRRMIERLAHGESTIGDLAQPFGITLAGASKHLGILEQAGLISREKRGRERVCSLQPEALGAASEWIARYSTFWNERLDALETALKEDGDE